MEEAEHLYSIIENKTMLERIKLILNLKQEETRIGVHSTTNIENAQDEIPMACDSNYDNSVTEVVDEDILNQAKEMFRLLKEEETMKIKQLNDNAYSVDKNKDNVKPVKHIIFNKHKESNTPVIGNSTVKFERDQNLLKEDDAAIQTPTEIILESTCQHSNGDELEKNKTPRALEYHNPRGVRRRRKERSIEKSKPSNFSSEGFPLNWTNVSELVHSSYSEAEGGQKSIRVLLEPGKDEYDSILNDFSSSHISFTKVERFQTTRNLQEFKFEMDCCIQSKGSGFNFGTMYLYHCTTEKLEKACNKGLNVTDKGPLGSGIYFSDKPGVCIRQIRRQTSARVAHMLKCRVIMRNVEYYSEGEYDKTLRRELRKQNRDSSQGQCFDSVMVATKDGSEVVVYEERRILIEYIIHLNTGAVDRLKLGDESEC